MNFQLDYATPSAYDSDRERALLGLSTDRRRPLRFHGKVCRHAFLLRVALRTFGEVLWKQDSWWGPSGVLDPILTVHPDFLLLEAFSADQNAYAQLRIDPGLFEIDGEVIPGTSTVDFTGWLWAALGEMRTSRETWLRLGSEGTEVKTKDAGGRFQASVEVPDAWLRGFLSLQEAMAMPGTRFRCRPVDLLAPIRYLQYNRARVSPRGMRFVFNPGEEPQLILEPWEQAFVFKGAEHHYAEPHSTRVWGRRGLRLLEKLMPFADEAEVYLKGRAMPSFYRLKLSGIEFLVGLSGWSNQRWTKPGGASLLGGLTRAEPEDRKRAGELLMGRGDLSVSELASEFGWSKEQAARSLSDLCREGKATYDLPRRRYLWREIFVETLDLERLFPPDRRSEQAERFLLAGAVKVTRCEVEETRKLRRFKREEGTIYREIRYRDWKLEGTVDEQEVTATVNDTGKIIFGTCACQFFSDHLLTLGPCEHLLALYEASANERLDLPTSVAAEADEMNQRQIDPDDVEDDGDETKP